MKTTRFLSMLAAICFLPLSIWAQEAGDPISVSIVGTPGSTVTINGEAVTIPASGELNVDVPPGASIISSRSIRVRLPSGAVVNLGANSGVIINGQNSVEITNGVAVVNTIGATSPTQVATRPGAIVRTIGSANVVYLPDIIEQGIRQTDENQVTPPNVSTPTPTPLPTPTPPVGTPT